MNLLILGANSDVAYAVAKTFAREEKTDLYLASRDMELLQKKANDIRIRYNHKAEAIYFNASEHGSHKQFYESLDPKPDGVVLAIGYLGNQEEAQQNFNEACNIITTNFLDLVSILEIIASDFENRGSGFIIGISSVAGERGRQSNYMYGSAKGGFTVYLSGLRNRLYPKGIHVTTVLPGFIRTKMTEDIDLPKLLTASPDEVAEDIYKAFKKNKSVVYTKWFWKWIMAIIKTIPELVFKRMKL